MKGAQIKFAGYDYLVSYDDKDIPKFLKKEIRRMNERERNFWRRVRKAEKTFEPNVLETLYTNINK